MSKSMDAKKQTTGMYVVNEQNDMAEPAHSSWTGVKPFPTHVFPAPLRRLIEEGARSLPSPEDFVGVLLLPTLATAIGRTRAVQIKPGWMELPQLWCAVV